MNRKMIFCGTKAPLKNLRDGNTVKRVSAVATRRVGLSVFRRDRVSEVCQCGGIVLAFPLGIPHPNRATLRTGRHEIRIAALRPARPGAAVVAGVPIFLDIQPFIS
jgi:hypothetical protein